MTSRDLRPLVLNIDAVTTGRGTPALTKVASGSYFVVMRAVGLKVLKNKLSEYVRLAASGETVLVTDRDRVVAELVPPRTERGTTAADALMAEDIRKGLITPALRPGGPMPPRNPVMSFDELMRQLDEDRADR